MCLLSLPLGPMIAAIVEAGASTTTVICVQMMMRRDMEQIYNAYHGAKIRKQVTLSFLELLLRIRLKMKCGLAGLLIGGSLDPDLVVCHNVLHNLAEGSRPAIFTCRRKVDRRQSERFSRLRSMRRKTRASNSAPGRYNRFGSSTWRMCKGRKCLLRVGIEGSKMLELRDWGRDGPRREGVWSTFELVQSL